MPVLQQNGDFLEATLAAWFVRKFKASGLGLVNAIARRTYYFAEMMRSRDQHRLVQGGRRCEFHTLLRQGGVHGFVGPYTVRQVKQPQHLVMGFNDWSFYEWNAHIEDIEAHLNRGDIEKLMDLLEVRIEAVTTEAANELEESWLDPVGNADRLTSETPPFPGAKYHVTRDGHHVNGESVVSGINVANDPRWLNKYCGPLGSNLTAGGEHDPSDTITSAAQILRKVRKMNRYVKFASPNGTKYAPDDKKLMVAKQKIICDEMTYEAWEEIQDALGHGEDNLKPAELQKPDPHWRGIPLEWSESLGLGSAGLPAYVHSSVADPGRGAFSAGEYPNTGELYMLNFSHLQLIGLEGVFPERKPLEFLFDQQLMVQLFRLGCTTVCTDRQRQGVIWGYGPIVSS